MKKLLLFTLVMTSVTAFANQAGYDFLPKDCSLSRQDAFELTQRMMNERGAIADLFEEQNLSKDKIRTMDADQIFKTHTEYSNLEFRVHQAAQEFAHYVQVQCRHLKAWK